MRWENGVLHLLDQREIPEREVWLELRTWQEVRDAIRDMAVRGAPAIGAAAAYGMVLAALSGSDRTEARAGLAASRPTAVNLFWALDRMDEVDPWTPEAALAKAQAIEQAEVDSNARMASLASSIGKPGCRVLTICNTGALATPGVGTALGVIRELHRLGWLERVYSCETRPRQQGLKLTAWELHKEGIPFRSIVDSAAASLMAQGQVDFVVAGADRIVANGDTANKIGTYMLAVLAQHHGLPFYIVAPSSTVDPALQTGAQIEIEEREAAEITGGLPFPVWNPGFDVTPGDLITGIVTERGLYRAPYDFAAPKEPDIVPTGDYPA